MPNKATHKALHTPEPSVPGIDVVRTAWATIKGHLAHRRDQIHEEIRNYPPPIPACDQQYNHLLEQRTQISRELTRLDRAMNESLADKDPTGRIERFMQSSNYVDAGTAQRISALLTQAC